ncbi:MAG: hypothetical protein QF672_14135 [SAR202 cluster bacterium]|nr:hypothetical protein [SAR202 cluster bacterium]
MPCPSGKVVIAGGYAASIDDVNVPVNLPLLDGTGWRIRAIGPSIEWVLDAYAICANL